MEPCGNLPARFQAPVDFSFVDGRCADFNDSRHKTMAYAIIKTGGKQYRVNVGDTIDVEKLDLAEGDTATFDQVLAHGEGESINVGRPTLAGATVVGKVVSQYRGEKLVIFKFRRRKGFHKKKGHRQDITKVEITAINA